MGNKQIINNSFSTTLAAVCTIAMIATFASGCKKNELKSKYASLLQHKWDLKSTSTRTSVLYSFQGLWNTVQDAPDEYREYTSGGTLTITSPGFTFSDPYQLMSDSVILTLHPATLTTGYSAPDTAIIREINDSLFVSYSRVLSFTPNYSSLDEILDTLVR
jgi:hypothetical protein